MSLESIELICEWISYSQKVGIYTQALCVDGKFLPPTILFGLHVYSVAESTYIAIFDFPIIHLFSL